MQKIAIINRGIPATGKSTIINEIIKSTKEGGFSSEICSTDDFFMIDGEYRFDATKLQENHLKNQDKFFNALKNGIDVVICDNTNLSPWEAKPYYNMAKQFEYKVLLLDFAPRSIDDILKTQTHSVPKEVLESMLERYENEKIEEFSFDEVIKIEVDEFEKIKQIIGYLIVKKLKTYLPNEIGIIPKEYRIIIKELSKRKIITAYDIAPMLDKSEKQAGRYLDEMTNQFKNIIQTKQGKRKAYKLIDNFDIFIDIFKQLEKIEEIEEALYITKESNPELFKRLNYSLNSDDIFMFRGAIFESVKDKKLFNHLKTAIKYNEYIKIRFRRDDVSKKDKFIEVKPIKLVFIDNNWYLAYVEDEKLYLGRVNFIEEIEVSNRSYQKSSIKEQLYLLENRLQNSMTDFNKPLKTATIKASKNVSRYFKKEMKKFFPSQTFIEEKDGEVIFSIEYTQSLEILPFIQKWLPDLEILSPKELKEEFLSKIEKVIR